VFVTVKHFHPNLTFPDQVMRLPLKWSGGSIGRFKPCLQIFGKGGSDWECQTLQLIAIRN